MTQGELVVKVRQEAHGYLDMCVGISESDLAGVNAAEDEGQAICGLAGYWLSSAAEIAQRDAVAGE